MGEKRGGRRRWASTRSCTAAYELFGIARVPCEKAEPLCAVTKARSAVEKASSAVAKATCAGAKARIAVAKARSSAAANNIYSDFRAVF
jgi:hypothetical protein